MKTTTLFLLILCLSNIFISQVLVMETGSVSLDHTITTITLNNTFVDPVVFALPPSDNGSETATVRLKDITPSSFKIYLEEPSTSNNFHMAETVHYIVVEKGAHVFGDGTYIEAGTINSIINFNFNTINFSKTYSTIPCCFSQIQTDNSSTQFLHTRQISSTTSSFKLALEREESLKTTLPSSTENIGYLIISAGTGTIGGVPYEAGFINALNDGSSTKTFTQTLTSGVHFLSSISTTNGGDPSVLRWTNLDENSVSLFVDEDISNDTETNHTNETGDYFVINDNSGLGIYRAFALPVELITFEASLVNDKNQVKLNWETATEINNNYFIVERSINGKKWEKITQEEGAINSSTTIKYESIDESPQMGISYYRLKQVDLDGRYTYSSISSINYESMFSSNQSITVSPNPFLNQVTIQGRKLELTECHFYNLLGLDVTNQINVQKPLSNTVILDVSNLNSGVYLIKTKTKACRVFKK